MTLKINSYQNSSYTGAASKKQNQISFSAGFSGNAFRHSKSSKLVQAPNIFVRIGDLATEGLARGLGALASLKPVQKLTYKLHNSKNGMLHLISGVSVVLTVSTIRNIQKSKKIEKKDKLPLTLNQILTTAVTIAGAYTIDGALNKGWKKFTDTFNHVNKDLVKKNPRGWARGLDLTKKLAITGLLYRYVGPVLVTPVANKLSTKITEARAQKANKAQIAA